MSRKKFWKIEAGDGNYMGARAFLDARIQLSALFQITPTTQVAEWLAEFKREGLMPNCELLLMEGEDAAFTACHTGSQCGLRVGTGSCAQGLLFGSQPVKSLSGSRCPVVTLVAMRATSAPISIHASHDDVTIFRDAGLITLIAKDPSEVYSLTLLAFKIAEDPAVQLPVFVAYDGFDVSHTVKTDNRVLTGEGVQKYLEWLGEYNRPNSLLNPGHPVSLGGLALPPYFMEMNYGQMMAMENVLPVAEKAIKEFSHNFWKSPSLTVDYRTKDADYIIIGMGSAFGTMKEAADKARENGLRVGAIAVTMYRPFPVMRLRKLLSRAKAVAVLDRAPTFGAPSAPLGADIAATFLNQDQKPAILNCVYGLGGRTLSVEEILSGVIDPLTRPNSWKKNTRPIWLGVRGGK